MKRYLPLLACVLVGTLAQADEQRKNPCQFKAPDRKVGTQGNLLWGTAPTDTGDESSSWLTSIQLASARLNDAALSGLGLADGRLVTASAALDAVEGTVFQGQSSEGEPVEVALCDAEPSRNDPTVVWYRIQVWNTKKETWENPCLATNKVPSPRALAVRGIWNSTGDHQAVADQFTFACENGAIAKCIKWGYTPWGSKDGKPIGPLHQACTRMARADYCGNGRSHTVESTVIDMYDVRGIQQRTTQNTPRWPVELARFEAEWAHDGAVCVNRTRDGRTTKAIMDECPGRFEVGVKDLGDGDRCTLRRKGKSAEEPMLRNSVLEAAR